jgi:hypothetical protein
MPKDKRLYMTFPIDFDEHPKIAPLSDAAFRAFVEMNGYSRRQNLDGKIPARYALRRWGADVLDELIDTDPERPVVIGTGDAFVIRDYAEHQETTESIAKRRKTAALNGAKGGRPPKGNPAGYATETQSVSAAVSESEPNENQSQSQSQESESRADLDTQLLPPSSLDPAARDFSQEEIEGFRKALSRFGGDGLDDLGLRALVALLVEASPRPVTNYVGYVVRCTQRSPQKVRGLAEVAAREASRVPSLADIAADMDRAVPS